MGAYIVAWLEHTLEADQIFDAADLLRPALESMREHAGAWEANWRPAMLREPQMMEWQAKKARSSFDMDVCELDGPYGMSLEIGPRFCEIRPAPKWGAFITAPGVEQAVTAFSTAVAACLGGRTIVYLPDNAYRPSAALDFLGADAPLEAIIDWLALECGPPSPSVSSIYSEVAVEGRHAEGKFPCGDGYYIAPASIPLT